MFPSPSSCFQFDCGSGLGPYPLTNSFTFTPRVTIFFSTHDQITRYLRPITLVLMIMSFTIRTIQSSSSSGPSISNPSHVPNHKNHSQQHRLQQRRVVFSDSTNNKPHRMPQGQQRGKFTPRIAPSPPQVGGSRKSPPTCTVSLASANADVSSFHQLPTSSSPDDLTEISVVSFPSFVNSTLPVHVPSSSRNASDISGQTAHSSPPNHTHILLRCSTNFDSTCLAPIGPVHPPVAHHPRGPRPRAASIQSPCRRRASSSRISTPLASLQSSSGPAQSNRSPSPLPTPDSPSSRTHQPIPIHSPTPHRPTPQSSQPSPAPQIPQPQPQPRTRKPSKPRLSSSDLRFQALVQRSVAAALPLLPQLVSPADAPRNALLAQDHLLSHHLHLHLLSHGFAPADLVFPPRWPKSARSPSPVAFPVIDEDQEDDARVFQSRSPSPTASPGSASATSRRSPSPPTSPCSPTFRMGEPLQVVGYEQLVAAMLIRRGMVRGDRRKDRDEATRKSPLREVSVAEESVEGEGDDDDYVFVYKPSGSSEKVAEEACVPVTGVSASHV